MIVSVKRGKGGDTLRNCHLLVGGPPLEFVSYSGNDCGKSEVFAGPFLDDGSFPVVGWRIFSFRRDEVRRLSYSSTQ